MGQTNVLLVASFAILTGIIFGILLPLPLAVLVTIIVDWYAFSHHRGFFERDWRKEKGITEENK